MDYKQGFNKQKFEEDHFVFRRGSGEKFFHGWDDVRYEGGISPLHANTQDLTEGNMSRPLYEFLCQVYGEDGMAKYFPTPEKEQKRKPVLHFGIGATMANGVGKQNSRPTSPFAHLGGKAAKTMTDEELDELATLLCGSAADVASLHHRKGLN